MAEMNSPTPAAVAMIKRAGGRRRSAVCADVMPADTRPELPPALSLSETDAGIIKKAMENNILFSGCDSSQLETLLLAYTESNFSKGDYIIRQGEPGDHLYIIRDGSVDTFVSPKGKEGDLSEAKLVSSLKEAGDSFGELALMFNQPRAATVVATSATRTWMLSRTHFRGLLNFDTYSRKNRYQEWTRKVPLLANLTDDERVAFADALTTVEYSKGQKIIEQGEQGDFFYIIEEGECVVHKATGGGASEPVGTLRGGDFFGELALLMREPRAATVTAESKRVRCARVDQDAFTRLLGPCQEILSRQVYHSSHRAAGETELKAATELLNRVSRIVDQQSGCPWVGAKSVSNIVKELDGELKEVQEALSPLLDSAPEGADGKRSRDQSNVQEHIGAAVEELGDVLFCSMLLLKVLQRDHGAANGHPDCLAEAFESINAKLERRLPYIFGSEKASTLEEASAIWQRVKAEEKAAKRPKTAHE